jgi:tetratricopeptide (TPR) repeat protein
LIASLRLFMSRNQRGLLDKAFTFKSFAPYLDTLDMRDSAISAFRKVLLFNPDNAIAFAEIGKIQKERGLALAQYGRGKEAIEAYLEASQLNPEDAKLHANLAELFYYMGDYEKSGLSYKRAIQLDSRFEAVYVEKSKGLLDKAFESLTPYLRTLYRLDSAINAFRSVLLFNSDDGIAPAEIGKIQKEVESLRSCPICYKGTMIYTDKRANSASVILCSDQSDEEVRIFLLKGVKDSKYFSRTADGWRISFTFPLPETDFRVEVLRNEAVIAYGYYWIKNGYLGRDEEYNIYLTIAYKPAGKSSEGQSNNRDSNSTIYVPDRKGGRNRRVRRGS